MKISILALHLNYGGVERCIATLANILSEKYEVEIACSYKLNLEPAFKINSCVQIKYLTDVVPNENEFRGFMKRHRYLKAFREGIKSVHILKLRKSTMVNYIKKCDSDVIIATRDIFDEWLGQYGRDGVLKIGWEHNHYHDSMKYADKIKFSCTNLDYLVLVSKSLEAFYRGKMRGTGCKCIYIPNVIDNMPKENEMSALDEKRLISVGRLSPEKGFLDLLKIFNIISHDYPDWHLDIIGDGPSRASLEKYIKHNKLEEKVTLHGFQDRNYIFNMMQTSSIYLMTSYTESFGIVLLEAMSCGLPCISFSSAEGANELIHSGSNGYLIKNRNFAAYIKKCEDLINDKESRKKIGLEGRRTVSRFTSDMIRKEWFSILEKK
ncbi:MAG: glycosyltransferase family 4 protein [Bacilli bacterium]|nr:glycosyltransferase family 4 protein [Bacilli bacterium]